MCCHLTGLWTFKNRLKHTQLNVCEKEELPCFLYLIQIFELNKHAKSWLTYDNVVPDNKVEVL